MLPIVAQIKIAAAQAINHLYPAAAVTDETILVNETKPEFAGDYTVVLFPFVKSLRQNPAVLGKAIGEYLLAHYPLFTAHETVAGFLNLTVADTELAAFLNHSYNDTQYGQKESNGQKVMIEYSSPNTNKPLHFGHLRNNFLGWSVAAILKANGYEVIKANLVNDRGIHICKSMIAWMRYADGATPESTGIKGDHLVGDYYVKFNDVYKREIDTLVTQGMDKEKAEKEAPIMLEAQELLRKWEAGDPEVYALWQKMNSWVYQGFDASYKKLGIDFDKMYYESDTYLLGKAIVEEGLAKGVLFKKDNGSVWIDLTADGLDEKLLLRADGTSVYMTQDLGTARLKYNDFHMDRSAYVIADEQNYHMQVLKLILQKLGEPCAEGIYHLSYGMVELPSGRMKSREGTVVDADDMVAEMIALAREQALEAGKTEDFAPEEQERLYDMVGLGALKFYLLRVEPRKKMIFDPKESIDLHGFTATFIQYAHVRICSVLRKNEIAYGQFTLGEGLAPLEKSLLLKIEQYPSILDQAAKEYNPSLVCNYAFQLAQLFNSFFAVHSINQAESEEKRQLRLMLVTMIGNVIRHAMSLLGIEVPQKM
ncbi:arginine--tRNA ligase [Taibaiella koreensis]|uniref:arginine--tRNA ligase n=1 Tax=Taibaiella koreensis TaxID=1268548 RepID=UPI000E59F46F|nr:arginine--tRNA ligase [Taibaiella koreensis]